MANQFKTDDVDLKFRHALRGAAGGNSKAWICPLCNATFLASIKLWIHGKTEHPDEALMRSGDEAEAKKVFLQKAQQQATSNKAEKDPLTNTTSTKDPISEEVGEEGEHDGRGRPHSAPGYHGSGPPMEAENMSPMQPSFDEAQAIHISANVPQKRGVEAGIGVSEHLREGRTRQMNTTRGRHGHTTSGGYMDDKNFESRSSDVPKDSEEFTRESRGPKKPLYDSLVDPPAGRNTRSSKDQNLGKTGARHQTGPSRNQGASFDSRRQPYTSPSQKVMQNIKLEEDQNPSPSDLPSVANTSIQYLEGQDNPDMLLQPETRPISHEQLVVEVKGIYAGLVMVEAKCIDVDEKQASLALEKDPAKRTNLKDDQWQSLIALHKQLLHEHHDFFLASQHPSANSTLRNLATKYSMPARMWRHGIHAFLEVLRHRLPRSLEHMLAFIYIAYSMMALLYETVSAFEETWIECLGDLGRYRMAIEDDEPKDREIWSNVARFWYNKAADRSPAVGRLYHHLAILARPYTWEQLSLYARSLTCVTPFESARGSIMTLFNPILHGKDNIGRRPTSVETLFIRAHANYFTSQLSDSPDKLSRIIDELLKNSLFASYIIKSGSKFRENGVFAAVSNIAMLFQYGLSKQGPPKPRLRYAYEEAHTARNQDLRRKTANQKDNIIMSAPIDYRTLEAGEPVQIEESSADITIIQPSRLAFLTLGLALSRPTDKNVFPLVHVYLVFILSMLQVQQYWQAFKQESTWKTIEMDIPWVGLCNFLNALLEQLRGDFSKAFSNEFPQPSKEKGDKDNARPLPEDFVLRGQLYSQWYFPDKWFTNVIIDDDERTLELPSMGNPRMVRLSWLGRRIASYEIWIRYDEDIESYLPTDYLLNELQANVKAVPMPAEKDTVMSEPSINAFGSDRTSSWDSSKPSTDSRPTSIASTTIDRDTGTSSCTPTVTQFRSAPPSKPTTPAPIEPERTIEDTPMADISPGKDPPVDDLEETATWPQDDVVDSGASPPRRGKPREGGGLESDPVKLRELSEYADEDNVEDIEMS